MHVHGNFLLEVTVRTTIELSERHRARLLELAARRGMKGYSKLVEEAVEVYLRELERSGEAQRRALGLRGALPDEDVEALRRETRRIREQWR